MSKMIEIKGKRFSADTIAESLTADLGVQFPPQVKPYQFQAGDVAENVHGLRRVIVKSDDGVLMSVDGDGTYITKGQAAFEYAGYKKIGTLKERLLW